MRARVVLAAVLVAGYVVLRLLDAVIYRLIGPSMEGRAALEGEDWYWLLRVAGSLWAWIVVAAGLVSLDAMGRVRRAGRSAWRRGAFVLGSAVGAGVGAELAKLVLARERPSVINGGVLEYQGHVYRGLFAGFADGSNLGLPSSHAAVAAGGAFALAMVSPALWPLMLGLAGGCGLTRMLTGAHFATDVYAGMVLGWVVAFALSRVLRPAGKGDA